MAQPDSPTTPAGDALSTGSLPPEPVRRRVRAAILRGAVRGAGLVPQRWVAGALRPVAGAVFRGRYGAAALHNLEHMGRGIRALDPGVADRLAEAPMFHRDLARFASEQASNWIRLARGAEPGNARGAWVDEAVELAPSIERLDRVLAEGRGAIIVTAHIGDWELLCARLRRRGHRGAVVGRVRRRDSSHRWLTDMRRAYGVDTIAQDAPARDALTVLRGGGILGLLTDLRVKRLHGRMVPMFGAPALTMTAPAAFARVHRAPLVPIRCVRPAGRERYLLSVEPPLDLDADGSRDERELRLLTRQNAVFERWILETPEQWAWHQRRFGPESESELESEPRSEPSSVPQAGPAETPDPDPERTRDTR